ncbi:MAG: RsmE family RNA methyltransferase, partial [Spirochaetales bacterium]
MNMILFNEQEQFFFPTNDERAQHIIHILKKKPGDVFEAGIENAQAGQAKITAIDETGIYFDFEKTGDGKPANPIELIIGFVRPIQLKRIFRDIAGLGVQKVHLVATELGEKSYMNSKIAERGTAHAALRDGAMQAMSTHIPELVIHDCLEKCLNKLHTQDKLCMPVCLDTAQANISFTEYLLQKKIF